MISYSKFWNPLSRFLVGSLSSVLVLASTATYAMQPMNETQAEMALAPSYCRDTQGYGNSGTPDAPSPAAQRWVGMMGKTFWAMHHYCWGQINMQRAMRSGTAPQMRQHLLGSVLDDYNFVLRYASANFVLLPEIHTRVGEVELLLSRPRDAEKSFAKARALKRDYWPAYSHWAEYLIKVGKTAEARKLVKQGLEYAPGSRVLREQYRVLGSRPDAVAAQPEASELSDTGDASAESEATPGEKSRGSRRAGSATR